MGVAANRRAWPPPQMLRRGLLSMTLAVELRTTVLSMGYGGTHPCAGSVHPKSASR